MQKEWKHNPPVPRGLNRSIWKTTFLPLPRTNSSPLHPLVSTNEPIPNIEPSVIPYQTNGPADPNLWDGNFSPISLLGVDEFLNGDAKNMACSLQRMAIFIKQRSLIDRDIHQFPQLLEVGNTAWEFIAAIYEAGWDKLSAGNCSKGILGV